MGSVKDLLVISPAYENQAGLGNFIFSDRYSVFDWGEMPDHIPNKGRSLAVMAAFNFEELERRGIKTHYQGIIQENGNRVHFSDLPEREGGAQSMQIRLARVYHPLAREIWEGERASLWYDYSFFEQNRGRINNYLIGLEIIFRNGLPIGSSVFGQFEAAQGLTDPKERKRRLDGLLRTLGLKAIPEPGTMLPHPVMDFTTKLEPGDRFVDEKEAFLISGLTTRNYWELRKVAVKVNNCITEIAEAAGFTHYDGKIEMIWDQELVVGDVLGTFDENRFSFRDRQISKEVLRQWYKRHQADFVDACQTLKKTGSGWQKRSKVKPEKLPPDLVTLVSQMYMAGCNRYTRREIFAVPELEQVLEKLVSYSE